MEDAEPHCGHTRADGDTFRFDELHQALGIERSPGQNERRARQRGRVGKAPAIDVKHRHNREDDITLADADTVGSEQIQCLQRDCPMRIDDALREAGGAGGVAHRGSRTLITVGIVEAVRIRRCEQFLIGDRPIGKIRQIPVVHHDHMPDAAGNRQLLELGQQAAIDHDHSVIRMFDDMRQIAGVEANVQCVKHGAHGGHGEVPFQVTTIVSQGKRSVKNSP